MTKKPQAVTDTAFLQARRALLLDHPFFGSLVMHLNAVEDAKAARGIWVDGRSVGFNPETMEALDLQQGAGLLAKGVMQCALGHHVRRGNRDRKLWNQASDLVICPEILDSKLPLPDGAGQDRTYQGQSVEQVYTALEREAQQQQDQNNGEGQQQPQQGAGNGKQDGEEGSGESEGDAQPQTGEVRDMPGDAGEPQASEAEKSDNEQEWKIAMQQALQNAQSRGNLPGSLQRLIEKAVAPVVSWKDETRRFMQALSRDDLSWSRPNRRFISQGLYLPAVHSEKLGMVVVVNDTSGSTQFAQAAFFSEMQAILEECAPERIIYVQQDTCIAKVDELAPGDEFPKAIHGGGGTDFRPVFEYLEIESIDPACMIFLTDLDGPFPDKEPAYPVLWAACAGPRAIPFGDIIPVDVSRER